MIKSSHGLLESDEKRNFVNGSDRTEAQKKWRVISKVITFYVNLGLQNCEKVRNYKIIGRVVIMAEFILETDYPSRSIRLARRLILPI